MNEEPFKSKEEEELFMERMLLAGFKMTASRISSDLPKDKPAFLLLTKDDFLYKKLRRWVDIIDVIILYNPEEYIYEDLKNLYALVIDEGLMALFPFQDLLEEKYVKAEIDLDLLKSILTDLKR